MGVGTSGAGGGGLRGSTGVGTNGDGAGGESWHSAELAKNASTRIVVKPCTRCLVFSAPVLRLRFLPIDSPALSSLALAFVSRELTVAMHVPRIPGSSSPRENRELLSAY